MSIFHCYECDRLIDGDYHPCQEHPEAKTELICDDCMTELEERMEEEIGGEDHITTRVPFDKSQRIAIAKMEQDGDHEGT